MRIIILLLTALAAFAQPETRLSQKNPDTGYQFILGYSGDNVIYICKAASLQPTSPAVSVTSISNAAAAVFTVSGGHGFATSSTPKITISGGTGNWTAVNGTYTATITAATTFTIAVDSSAFGAVTGTVVYTTRAPRTTSSIWSVQSLAYSAANLIWTGWANGVSSPTTTCTGAPAQAQ